MRDLQDMTLDELWELFPVVLSPHRKEWALWAQEEMASLSEILVGYCMRINHIGSTAIPGILAKPIVDILVELKPESDMRLVKALMERAGYICMSVSNARMSFNKGYTLQGYAERVFHIHFHEVGDNDEIAFRDYLRANPGVAKEYETLKTGLLPEYRFDRDGYTAAKSGFVLRVMSAAAHRGADSVAIRRISGDKRRYMSLLLIGDESEAMIEKYIERGVLYAGFAGEEPVAVCLVTEESASVIEVKNLAVIPGWRRRGVGRRMLARVESDNAGKKITLGTGETPSTLRFYRSCGYEYSHRVPDFFTDNYPAPIIEEGVRLKDMVYLSKFV